MINAIFMIIVIVVLMPTNYNYLDMFVLDIPSQTVMPLEIVAWSTNSVGTCKRFASTFRNSCGCGQA